MSKQFMARLLFFVLCAALLLIALNSSQPSEIIICEKELPAETAGTQLLWESLSHQFVSTVQY